MELSRMLVRQAMNQARIWGVALLLAMSLCRANAYAATLGHVCGDNVNVVDIKDALCTLRYVVGLIPHDASTEALYLAADVSPLDPVTLLPKGNGTIDIADALGILKHVVNLDSWISTISVSGTAAAGAPIVGSVTVKDSSSPAATKTVPIAADGKYTVDVTGMKAPYMVRADGYIGGNDYHLYSAGTSADVGGTINITPLTDLIVANIAKTVASDYFNNGNFSTLTTADLKIESDALLAKLQPILTAVGVSGSIDLLRASFSTNHTGIDAALDILRVNTTDTATGAATITNIITQQAVSSTNSDVLPNTAGVAAAATDIQLISAGFKTFSDLFATGLPSDTNATLLGLFDGATFMSDGQNLAAFLSQMTTEQQNVGVSFANISIRSMDANGSAVVAFDVIRNGVAAGSKKPFHMIKKNGAWYMQGDQYLAEVDFEAYAGYFPADTATSIVTGLNLYISDRGGQGITSAVVTGAGLPADGIILKNDIASDCLQIQGQQNKSSVYTMTDSAIATIAETDPVYTVNLYAGATLKGSYAEKLKKRPYLSTELTAASFPNLTSPTVAEIEACTGGDLAASWTLPDGLTSEWLSVQIGDYNGNSAMFQTDLRPTDTGTSFTLDPITSTGQSFAVSSMWMAISAYDSYARRLDLCISKGNNQPQNNSYVSIEGAVFAEGGYPIAGAVVATSLDAQTATTDASGHFSLQTTTAANYSTTPYTITITKGGYPTFSQLWNWGDHPTGQVFNLN